MDGIRALQQAGMVGEVGVSNASLERWRAAERALGGRVLSNQVGYSLISRSPVRDLLPFAKSHGRVVIAYRPLELGLLPARTIAPTGRPTRSGPRTRSSPQNLERARIFSRPCGKSRTRIPPPRRR